ncbi:hypothetical protein BKA82DRAFT_529506 [Pisolithus tinctorius]|uniref:Uncharacterized protein n=1 Tax=Pisolithus tinctorius Marx 270 TaxID=870435 RepID=A0A0C3NVS1_PISTI|nr:hypothetical protein BKA82DRAFT_529506 [Pisolithus tinctorius]KIO04960.1 hypothetical protein M404DRAFT_529506 [Pisolithus tinctorius Marx 270]
MIASLVLCILPSYHLCSRSSRSLLLSLTLVNNLSPFDFHTQLDRTNPTSRQYISGLQRLNGYKETPLNRTVNV